MKKQTIAGVLTAALACLFFGSLYVSTLWPGRADGGEAAPGALKTGLAVQSTASAGQDAAAGAAGYTQSESIAAAVLVDGDGRLVELKLDIVQPQVAIGADGAIQTQADAAFPTKMELGDEYGMRAYSGIGKEWYEQVGALADYVAGMTAAEITGIAVGEDGKATDADLLSGCTIAIADYLPLIAAAMDGAPDLGAEAGDTLGLGIQTVLGDSAAATAEGEGRAQTDTTLAAVSRDAGGGITSCLIDCVQAPIAFDAQGAVQTQSGTEFVSKRAAGDEYGMKEYSGIGREWYEQADAFARFITGKSIGEVTGIAVGEDGKSTDADLLSGCTIAVGDFIAAVEKAMA